MQSSNAIDYLSPVHRQALHACDPWLWAYDSKIRLVPGPFSLSGHEFQIRPMSIRPPVKVIMKGTQGTFTEGEVLNVLNGMIHGYYPVGVYYLFPTKDKVSEFSKSRFRPLIQDNPDTIGCHVRDTDSATLKRVGSGFLYFRSGRLGQEIQGQMKTSASLKGDPADHAVHDEYDEMSPDIDEFIDGRLAKSPIHTKTYLANPTLPDYGIDRKFQLSDQEYLHYRCVHCKRYTCFDDGDNFPNLFHRLQDNNVVRVCSNKRCGRPMIDLRFCEWVPKRSGIKNTIGFTIGHPSYPWINLKALLDSWENPNTDRANFTRLKRGRAYIEAENRLSVEQVLACCGDHGISSSDPGPCFMGVDQGGGQQDLFHIFIGKKDTTKKAKAIHITIEKGWLELDQLMEKFNIRRCIIDGLPNQDDARKFAHRFPGRVYLCYWNSNQKGFYRWNEEDYTVTANRTEAMDASHTEIAEKQIILPRRSKLLETFATHCNHTAKKLEEDEKDGSKRYVYIPKLGGPDHWRLAQCYEAMARNGAPAKLFGDL